LTGFSPAVEPKEPVVELVETTGSTCASGSTMRVREFSEEELLARILPLLPAGPGTKVGPGDDAAVLAAPDGRYVVTCDVLVEERHFRRAWSTGYEVGIRAVNQNVADVAAMGARPTAIVVGLAVPGDVEVSWLEDFARGLADACDEAGAGVVGGDLSSADEIVVSITAFGDLEGRAPVLRSGARPGDVLAHAGVLGYSAAGLAALLAGFTRGRTGCDGNCRAELGRHRPVIPRAAAASRGSGAADGVAADFEAQVAGYLTPNSPVKAGALAAEAGATAMMDVSDGLLRDAGRLARASRVHLDLDPAEIDEATAQLVPVADALGLTFADARAWVLAGGEDHGLLATFPPGAVSPQEFRALGTVRALADGENPEVTVGGQKPEITPGWDHFRS